MTRHRREQKPLLSLARRAVQHQRQHPVRHWALRVLPDLVTLASTPSGAARHTRSTGIGTCTKSRTRSSRSSDHRPEFCGAPIAPRHVGLSRVQLAASTVIVITQWFLPFARS